MTYAEAVKRAEDAVAVAYDPQDSKSHDLDIEALSVLTALAEENERLRAENFKLTANDLRFYRGKAEVMQYRAEKAEAELTAYKRKEKRLADEAWAEGKEKK